MDKGYLDVLSGEKELLIGFDTNSIIYLSVAIFVTVVLSVILGTVIGKSL